MLGVLAKAVKAIFSLPQVTATPDADMLCSRSEKIFTYRCSLGSWG